MFKRTIGALAVACLLPLASAMAQTQQTTDYGDELAWL